jgi:aminoglycoside phosphotransferase (APT) family kinase protein
VHLDVRSDNILIERDGRVVLVDWPHACIGAPWLDRVVMIPALALETGEEPNRLIDVLDVAAHRDAVDTLMASLAGYFVERGSRPDPPGLPTVRAFQRAQAEVALRWLRTRLGGPEPM